MCACTHTPVKIVSSSSFLEASVAIMWCIRMNCWVFPGLCASRNWSGKQAGCASPSLLESWVLRETDDSFVPVSIYFGLWRRVTASCLTDMEENIVLSSCFPLLPEIIMLAISTNVLWDKSIIWALSGWDCSRQGRGNKLVAWFTSVSAGRCQAAKRITRRLCT